MVPRPLKGSKINRGDKFISKSHVQCEGSMTHLPTFWNSNYATVRWIGTNGLVLREEIGSVKSVPWSIQWVPGQWSEYHWSPSQSGCQ